MNPGLAFAFALLFAAAGVGCGAMAYERREDTSARDWRNVSIASFVMALAFLAVAIHEVVQFVRSVPFL